MVHRLNQVVPFEYGAHLLMTLIFLFTMNILEFVLNLPLVAFNAWLYVTLFPRQSSTLAPPGYFLMIHLRWTFLTNNSLFCSVINGKHKLDEIKILQGDILPNLRKRELIKLIFFVVCFFLYLYKYVPTFYIFLLNPALLKAFHCVKRSKQRVLTPWARTGSFYHSLTTALGRRHVDSIDIH